MKDYIVQRRVPGALPQGLARQVGRRCASTSSGDCVEIVPTVLMITLVVFVMMRSVPGDPVVALLGDAYTRGGRRSRPAHAYGLDKPHPRPVRRSGSASSCSGDWGASILSGRPVLTGRLGPPARDARADRAVDGRGARHRGARRHHRRRPPEHLARLRGDDRRDDRRLHSRVLRRRPAPRWSSPSASGACCPAPAGSICPAPARRMVCGVSLWGNAHARPDARHRARHRARGHSHSPAPRRACSR